MDGELDGFSKLQLRLLNLIFDQENPTTSFLLKNYYIRELEVFMNFNDSMCGVQKASKMKFPSTPFFIVQDTFSPVKLGLVRDE